MTECYNGEPWISWEVLGLEVKVGLQHHHIHYPPPSPPFHQLLVLRSRSVHDDNSNLHIIINTNVKIPIAQPTNTWSSNMIKTAIALIAVINIITGQANTCHCHHSNIAININIPTDKCRCHHSCHPGRQVLSIFPLTSTVVIILFIQDDKYYHHFRHSGRQVQAAVEELLRHVALLERDCQASLAKISFHIFLAESKIQNVLNPSCQASSGFLAAMGYVQIVYQSFLPGSFLGKLS